MTAVAATDAWLAAREALRILGLRDKHTIYRMINDGELDGRMIANRWMITRHSIEQMKGGGQ